MKPVHVCKVTYLTDFDKLLVVACSYDDVSVFGSEALKEKQDVRQKTAFRRTF